MPVEQLHELEVDAVLYQSQQHWLVDRLEVLSERQRAVPQVVVEHGVVVPADVGYDGSVERGIVVVNQLAARGRRLGADVFLRVRAKVALDLVGMEAERAGGLGEVAPPDLPRFLTPYRFCFHPVRYTSLGLSVLEAMAVGLPVVGLATTELAAVIHDGVDGFVDTDVTRLVDVMHALLDDAGLARRIGVEGQALVRERIASTASSETGRQSSPKSAASGGRTRCPRGPA